MTSVLPFKFEMVTGASQALALNVVSHLIRPHELYIARALSRIWIQFILFLLIGRVKIEIQGWHLSAGTWRPLDIAVLASVVDFRMTFESNWITKNRRERVKSCSSKLF